MRNLDLKPTPHQRTPRHGLKFGLMILVIIAGFFAMLLQNQQVAALVPLAEPTVTPTVAPVLPICFVPPNSNYELPGSDYDSVVICLPVAAELVNAFDPDQQTCLWPGDQLEIKRSLEIWAFRDAYWYQVRVHRAVQSSSRPHSCAAVNTEGWVSAPTIDALFPPRP